MPKRSRLGLFVVALLLAMLVPAALATADRTFSTRFSTDDTGNITMAANTLMTCPAVAPTCAQARAAAPIASGGDNFDNNNFNMTYVNTAPGTVGGVASFDSSSALLPIPAGATVLFAGLYWGGDTSAGGNVGPGAAPAPAPNAAANGQVGFGVPGAPGYAAIPASTVDVSSQQPTRYSAFANVTSLVAAGGAGTYRVANVQAGTGGDRYAGWALVVAYHDSTDPPRNLTVDDGLVTVAAGSPPITVPIGGFKTPPSGPVTATAEFVAWEGDTGITGDSASLDGTIVSSAVRPATNFFDGAISNLGTNVTTRNPDDVNNFAVDAALGGATGLLPNGATSATIGLTTSGDTYFPAVVGLSVDLFAPVISGTKAVTNLTHPGGPDQPGDVLRYAVAFTNTGQDTATNFVMRDPIPGGATYVPGSLRITAGPQAGASPTDAADGDTGEFDAAANQVVLRLGSGATASSGGSVADGETDTATFEVRIDPSDVNGQQIVNQANASFSGQSLGHHYNIQTPQVVNTVAAPDLVILKSHAGALVGGVEKAFVVNVANAGGAPTDGSVVTVSDRLPASAFESVVGASGSGWSCNAAALTVTCSRRDVLAAGASYPPIEIDAVVQPVPPATVSNTATVSGGGDTNPANNSATDTAGASAIADLAIQKAVQPATLYSGGKVTYTLSVANLGPSTASAVTVSDPLPSSSYAGVSATSTQGSCDTAVSCSLGAIPAYSTATITITATVSADNTTLQNTATVSSPTTDPTPSNNSATVGLTVPPTADLSITKAGGGNNPTAGQPYTYTIAVTDRGPDTASGVVVSDSLPRQFTATSAAGGGFTCQLPGSAGGTLVCTRSTLAVGDGTQQIQVTGTFTGTSAAQTAANVATVSSQTADPDPANNGASLTQGITPAADLLVGKAAVQTDGVTPLTTALNPGQAFDYFITVMNNGPSDATGVAVSDPLPAGIVADPTRTAPADCTYDTPTNTFTCTLGTLAAGASTSIALPVMASTTNPGGVARNVATVTSPTPDPDPTTNSSSALVGVSPVADLELTKTQSLQSASVGATTTFTLTATNLGPNTTGARISDPLPAGLSFGASSDCTFSAPNVSCDLGGLAAGASKTVSFTATVAASAAGTTLTNTATVTSEPAGAGFPQLGDFYPSNNTASAALPVNQRADLSLTKSVSTATTPVGNLVSYTLTASNAGPNAATDVKIADPIPAGLGFVDATNGCTNITGTVTCQIGGLPSGASASVTIRAWVLGSAAGHTLVNTAAVAGDQPDPNPANNQATATTTVPVPPTLPQAVKLTIAKKVNHKHASYGAELKYTVTINNAGPGIAVTPTITDKFSGAASIVSVHAPSGSCKRRKPLTCTLATLPPGGHAKITLAVRAHTLGKLRNTASVTTPTPLAAGSRTLAIATSTIRPGPHSRLVLHDRTSTPRIPAGGTATFHPTVTNPNHFLLHKVQVCDQLPAGTMFVLGSGRVRHVGRHVCWTIATLRAHASKSFWVRAETLLGVTGPIHDAATATTTAAGHRLTAHANAHVLVGSGQCRSASDRPPLNAFTSPFATIAC